MSRTIPLSEQSAIVRSQADSAPPRTRAALLAGAETIETYRRLRMTASEALEARRIDDAKLTAAFDRSRTPR